MPKHILSIGNCAADHNHLNRSLQKHFDVELTSADTAQDALTQLQQGTYDLILINRIFDANGDSGLDLIKKLKADPALAATPTMLISNFPEAQQEAQSAGALPGFGKNSVGKPHFIEHLKPYLNP